MKSAEHLEQERPGVEISWQQFSVSYSYPVCFTTGLFNPANPVLKDTLNRLEPGKRHRLVVFIDSGVIDALPELPKAVSEYAQSAGLALVVPPIPTPAGESVKSDWTWIQRMRQIISDNKMDRHSYVIGVGGGALLDAVGFVAATSHRGIRHVRVPTTVLGQNDSGVGVKNSLNLFGQKNYMGTFTPPFAVLNDYDFIERLSDRDKVAGMAEAVKVALIRDATFYEWLEQQVDSLAIFQRTAMNYMIKRCAELHLEQIALGGDPFETGSARPLDFGHWSAHRLETLTGYTLRHGEAVAIGIALDARYSAITGLLDSGSDERICLLLEQLGFKLWHPGLEQKNALGRFEVLQGLTDFCEHLGGELTITLLAGFGEGVEVHEMDEAKIMQAIGWMKQRQLC